jgi:hypothetical protein
MTSFKTFLAASIMASVSATGAFGEQQYGTWDDQAAQQQSGVGSTILNNQVNLQTNWSALNGSVDTVGGDVVIQGNAASNQVDVTTMNDTRVLNNQVVGSNATVGSSVAVDVNNVWGSVGVSNQVICNGASVSTDPILTAVTSNQDCHAKDPYSGINTNISNIGGNAIVQGLALGNKLETDSNAPNFPVISRQLNTSGVVSNANANIFNAAGTVGLSSSAIGNSAQVLHYSTN